MTIWSWPLFQRVLDLGHPSDSCGDYVTYPIFSDGIFIPIQWRQIRIWPSQYQLTVPVQSCSRMPEMDGYLNIW